MDYKILERNGIFLVGTMVKKRKYLWSKPHEEFKCTWKGMYSPAHFETLEDARNFVKKITKPDTYHKL
jgi:hypothetical protein